MHKPIDHPLVIRIDDSYIDNMVVPEEEIKESKPDEDLVKYIQELIEMINTDDE